MGSGLWKIIIKLIVKIRRKINRWETYDYLNTLKTQCECDGAILHNDCSIYNGHADGTKKNIVIEKNAHIRGELQTFGHGGKIRIGQYSYVGPNTRIWSGRSIDIGNRVLVGPNCCIFDNDIHPLDPELRHKQFVDIVTKGQPAWVSLNDKEVIIKDDAWIGCNVVILKGVTIGKGAIVGAGSVVTHDIPDYAIAHGNPAVVSRIMKEI